MHQGGGVLDRSNSVPLDFNPRHGGFTRPPAACLPFASVAAPWRRKMFFSREGELRALKLLAERGFGPALLATLEDGRVEEFLEGRVSRSLALDTRKSLIHNAAALDTEETEQQSNSNTWHGCALCCCVSQRAVHSSSAEFAHRVNVQRCPPFQPELELGQ